MMNIKTRRFESWLIWGAAAWVLLGIACLATDRWTQPRLVGLSRVPLIHATAEEWQKLGSTPGILMFTGFGLWRAQRDGGRTVYHFIATLVVVAALCQTLKYLVGRPRPMWNADAICFLGPLGLFRDNGMMPIDSMPSGHTAAAFAMVSALHTCGASGR